MDAVGLVPAIHSKTEDGEQEGNKEQALMEEETTAKWTNKAKKFLSRHKSDLVVSFNISVRFPTDFLSTKIGTLVYMAPEVYLGVKYDDKSVIFSFGIIAYEILHRFRVMHALGSAIDEAKVYVKRMAKGGYRPPVDVRLPTPLQDLIRIACWANDPSDRPSMKEVQGALEGMQDAIDWKSVDRVYDQNHSNSLQPDGVLVCGCCLL
ncbi:hypothetical protein CEUSTIGMA_g3583.t1 [Chlamydomonas eustigma]|uniref:Protein kinase domain-containing protein n=1 Tax=Chlamydomonas eustigma TaxID=1157962 RepID=A0A250X057_9CHLO|nr:hypothetical protein CEUSTIGMA_g3583.t1 [Chlamydomonas eustigma]|eukprot:GAX76140.1 hypothetical protein CEUSTIGMA_g3583.t1 [Chlamydomonas eustigma]